MSTEKVMKEALEGAKALGTGEPTDQEKAIEGFHVTQGLAGNPIPNAFGGSNPQFAEGGNGGLHMPRNSFGTPRQSFDDIYGINSADRHPDYAQPINSDHPKYDNYFTKMAQQSGLNQPQLMHPLTPDYNNFHRVQQDLNRRVEGSINAFFPQPAMWQSVEDFPGIAYDTSTNSPTGIEFKDGKLVINQFCQISYRQYVSATAEFIAAAPVEFQMGLANLFEAKMFPAVKNNCIILVKVTSRGGDGMNRVIIDISKAKSATRVQTPYSDHLGELVRLGKYENQMQTQDVTTVPLSVLRWLAVNIIIN